MIKVKTLDSKVISLTEDIYKHITLINDMVSYCDKNDTTPIELDKISSESLHIISEIIKDISNNNDMKVMDELHKRIRKGLIVTNNDPFGKEDTNEKMKKISSLLLDCDYLSCDLVMMYGCYRLVRMIEDNSVEKLNVIMNMPNDFTTEEREKIYEQWGYLLDESFNE